MQLEESHKQRYVDPAFLIPCGMFAHYNPERDLSLPRVCLSLEYFYIRLCGLSPAAHVFESSSGDDQRDPNMPILSQLANDAVQTSIDLLSCVTHDLTVNIVQVRRCQVLVVHRLCLIISSEGTHRPCQTTNAPA